MGILDSVMDDKNIVWTSEWTIDAKPWDYDRPLRRINSPSFNKQKEKSVNGKGYDCGCRSPQDYHFTLDQLKSMARALGFPIPIFPVVDQVLFIILLAKNAFGKILRVAPAWVPVDRNGYDPNFKEHVEEIEGVLWHSFQTWTDVPVFEYHRWFDWNFHVIPAPQYDWLRGAGNEVEVEADLDRKVFKEVGSKRAMELEWDTGAFGVKPGSMFDIDPAGNFDPERDWVWPHTGQYIWAAGRHIYDCGHANSNAGPKHSGDKTGPNPGLMRTELHPCLAVATARWEAVKFDENVKPVPAIQFMFFSSRKGGQWEYDTIKPGGYTARRSENPDATKDYEFIVDLPKYESEVPTNYAIGATPDFPLNTLVIRPQLLIKFDDKPFRKFAKGKVAPFGQATPEVSIIPPKDPTKPPEQARVKIPLSLLPDDIDAYGVVISMGWRDLDATEAAKVRKVTVTLEKFHKGTENHDVLAEEWDVKIGINGRWHYVSTPDQALHNRSDFSMNNKRLELFLALDDYIYITAHGLDRNLEFDFMNRSVGDRRLRSRTGPSTNTMETVWKKEIDQADNGIAQRTANDMLFLMAPTLKDTNTPIGILDAAMEVTNQFTKNPIKLRDFIKQHGEGGEVPLHLFVPVVKDDEDSAELFYNPAAIDYILFYRVKVEPLA